MKYTIAVISDIHGNLEGLNTVLSDMELFSPDKIVCLGDIVGYGPDQCQCLDIMLGLKNTVFIKGNHEDIYLGEISTENCSSLGKISAEWTVASVSEKYHNILSKFLNCYEERNVGFYHTASVIEHEYPYLKSLEQIIEGFENSKKNICFYGHTHRTRITAVKGNGISDRYIMASETIEICPNVRYYINVGSAGQQRDAITDCSYGVIEWGDSGIRVHIRRLEYDSYKTYSKIKDRIKSDELATYLIREEERRTRYENTYNRR